MGLAQEVGGGGTGPVERSSEVGELGVWSLFYEKGALSLLLLHLLDNKLFIPEGGFRKCDG